MDDEGGLARWVVPCRAEHTSEGKPVASPLSSSPLSALVADGEREAARLYRSALGVLNSAYALCDAPPSDTPSQ